MFASLNGTIIEINEDNCTLDVAGVGYLIYCSPNVLDHLNLHKTQLFYIQTIVKEDSISLYGFTEITAKKLFNLLITVQGVGPRIAMAVLSTYNANQIVQAIMIKDIDMLKKINGIGLKVAQRLANELFDKIKGFSTNSNVTNIKHTVASNNIVDATTALLALGYSNYEINSVVNKLQDDIKDLTAEEIIKHILKYFASNI